MGVRCEINIFKLSDGTFLPGSTVAGIMKYTIDKETVFNKINVSVKGNGRLSLEDELFKTWPMYMATYKNSEEYVYIENTVHNDDNALPLPAGSYEFPFSFTLSHSIPPSLHYSKTTFRYKIKCTINYFISVKFHRPGLFKFVKKFKKEIIVMPAIKARLPMEPTIYGKQKKLFLFSRKPNIVNIKANIECSVIDRGGRVNMNYEIFNHADLNLKGVETKLVEMYTFTAKGHKKVKMYKYIVNTATKTGAITSCDSQNMGVTINVPSDLGSLEYSNFVSRVYFVYVTVIIPFPHSNAVLKVPLQIGDTNNPSFEAVDDPLPSCWEVIAEDQKKGDGMKEDSNDEDSETDENSLIR